jgi:hypothetical protein
MKETEVAELGKATEAIVNDAQNERIVITRNGAPVAIVYGIENKDAEDIQYETSAEFWKMIEERRRMPTIPWDRAKKALLAEEGRASAEG